MPQSARAVYQPKRMPQNLRPKKVGKPALPPAQVANRVHQPVLAAELEAAGQFPAAKMKMIGLWGSGQNAPSGLLGQSIKSRRIWQPARGNAALPGLRGLRANRLAAKAWATRGIVMTTAAKAQSAGGGESATVTGKTAPGQVACQAPDRVGRVNWLKWSQLRCAKTTCWCR